MASQADHYAVLEVSEDADQTAIKKAYYKLSLQWHPDKCKAENAEEKFKEIAQAYSILSDTQKKTEYDRSKNPHASGSDQYGNLGANLWGTRNVDPYDMFSRAFNFGTPFDLDLDEDPAEVCLALTLEELYTGITKQIPFERKTNKLKRSAQTTFVVEVKPGCKAGTKFRYANEGHEKSSGRGAFDAVFVVSEKEHERFIRQDSNLRCQVELPLNDVLAESGCDVEVMRLDGSTLSVHLDPLVTESDAVSFQKTLQGEGMPISNGAPGQRGDLILKFQCVWPVPRDVRSVMAAVKRNKAAAKAKATEANAAQCKAAAETKAQQS